MVNMRVSKNQGRCCRPGIIGSCYKDTHKKEPPIYRNSHIGVGPLEGEAQVKAVVSLLKCQLRVATELLFRNLN